MNFLVKLHLFLITTITTLVLFTSFVRANTVDFELRPNTHQSNINSTISVTLYARTTPIADLKINALLSAIKIPNELNISNLLFNLNSNFVFNYLTSSDKLEYRQIEFMFVKQPNDFVVINDNTPIISFDLTTTTPGTYKIENSLEIPTSVYDGQNTNVFGTYNPPYLNLSFNSLVPTPTPTAIPTPLPSPSTTPTPGVPSPSPSPTAPSPSPTINPSTPVIINTRIENNNDDANESNSVLLDNSSSNWLGNAEAGQTHYLGLRFTNLQIPKGAKINTANIELKSTSDQWISLDLEIFGDKTSNSQSFNNSNLISTRSLTNSKILHSSNVPWNSNTWYQLEDISNIIQEIVDKPDWNLGNSISIILKGSGNPWARKFIYASESNIENAPKLNISYTNINGNQPTPTPAISIVPTPLPTPSPTPTIVIPSPTTVPTPTPTVKPIVISDIKLNGVKSFIQVINGLNIYAKQYIDRRYKFTYIPQKYNSLDYLQTYNSDKLSTGNNVILFKTNTDVRVYVAHDTRITVKPDWLRAFTKTNDVIISQNSSPFEIYYKDFRGGQVIIGGNQQTGAKVVKNSSNYTIFLSAL